MSNQKLPRIAVVGGVYRERCIWPAWSEVYGSAGRAASALVSMRAPVVLHTYLDEQTQQVIDARSVLEGFMVDRVVLKEAYGFEYDHGLAAPRVWGEESSEHKLKVQADLVLRFGFIEGDAVVNGNRVVYDPQNAVAPKGFRANGSTAEELVLLLNRSEATLLSRMKDAPLEEVAAELVKTEKANAVIVKDGPLGALVHDGLSFKRLPAYRSQSVWKIGSGDNFAAHFAFHWLHEGKELFESADLASRATAYYCNTKGFATPELLQNFNPKPVRPTAALLSGYRPKVYLAGPFFTLAQVWQVEQARRDLSSMGLDVFSPFHDVGHGEADDVVEADLAGLEQADLVFAICDGMDPGTIFEVGYARSRAKPVIALSENDASEDLKMLEGSDCQIIKDYVTAIYSAVWAACES